MGNEPNNSLLPVDKIRDYVRWPVQAMPKRAAQGSLCSVPLMLLHNAGRCSCFLIPGSVPGNASSHDVKKRSLTCRRSGESLSVRNWQIGSAVAGSGNSFQFCAVNP
jgi:hypothetical protein